MSVLRLLSFFANLKLNQLSSDYSLLYLQNPRRFIAICILLDIQRTGGCFNYAYMLNTMLLNMENFVYCTSRQGLAIQVYHHVYHFRAGFKRIKVIGNMG